MEEKEATHMDQVLQQFSQLKSTIEIQSTMGIINEENPNPKYIAYTSMSSPLTLGSRELPYFVTSASPGQVTLTDKNDAGNYRINIAGSSIQLTSIKYEAYNFYFINQDYILEGGGIILNQSDGEVMRVNPAMNIVNKSDVGIIEINYNIPVFVGIPGKKVDAGYEECYIRTNYTRYYENIISDASFIHIYTAHPDGWYHGLVNTSRGLLWEYCENEYLDVQIDRSTTPNRVIITPGQDYQMDVKYTVVEIGVQVGPGVIV